MGCHQPKRAILSKIVICITSSLALSDKFPTLVTNLGQVHAENDTPEHPLHLELRRFWKFTNQLSTAKRSLARQKHSLSDVPRLTSYALVSGNKTFWPFSTLVTSVPAAIISPTKYRSNLTADFGSSTPPADCSSTFSRRTNTLSAWGTIFEVSTSVIRALIDNLLD